MAAIVPETKTAESPLITNPVAISDYSIEKKVIFIDEGNVLSLFAKHRLQHLPFALV